MIGLLSDNGTTKKVPVNTCYLHLNMDERKKKFRRLVLSSDDLGQAKRFVNFILSNELYLESSEDQKLINRSMHTAAIISYARPFTNNRDKLGKYSTLHTKHLGALTEDERKFHDYIKDLRDQVFAHTDEEVTDLKIDIKNFVDTKTAFSIGRNTHAPLPKEHWIIFLRIINKVAASISEDMVEVQSQFVENESF